MTESDEAELVDSLTVHHFVPEGDSTCEHEWPSDDSGQTDDSGFCKKCGMSFMHYAFMEAP